MTKARTLSVTLYCTGTERYDLYATMLANPALLFFFFFCCTTKPAESCVNIAHPPQVRNTIPPAFRYLEDTGIGYRDPLVTVVCGAVISVPPRFGSTLPRLC